MYLLVVSLCCVFYQNLVGGYVEKKNFSNKEKKHKVGDRYACSTYSAIPYILTLFIIYYYLEYVLLL